MAAVPAGEPARPAQPLQVVQPVLGATEPPQELAHRPRVVSTGPGMIHPVSLLWLTAYPGDPNHPERSVALLVLRLEIVDGLAAEPALAGYHYLPSVRGDLLTRLGRHDEATAEFRRAAALTRNIPRAHPAAAARRRVRRAHLTDHAAGGARFRGHRAGGLEAPRP